MNLNVAAPVRSVTPTDGASWLQMRRDLWPHGTLDEHRQDIERYFTGDRREPAEVLMALDRETMVGFAELSIRNIVDG